MPQKGRVAFASETPHPDNDRLLEISCEELAQKAGSVHVVDVREDEEFEGELGHVDGARLMPLASIPARVRELAKDETIVFVCRSGGRSARATALALQAGFTHVFNMKGGMLRWNELGLPTQR